MSPSGRDSQGGSNIPTSREAAHPVPQTNAALLALGRLDLADDGGGPFRVRGGLEDEDRRVLPSEHLSEKEADVDPRVGNGARKSVTDAGLVVSLHEKRRNVGRRQTRSPGGGGHLLARDGIQLDRGPTFFPGVAVTHDDAKVGPRAGEWFQGSGERSGFVLGVAAPECDRLDFDGHGYPPSQTEVWGNRPTPRRRGAPLRNGTSRPTHGSRRVS